MMYSILIVDDERIIREGIAGVLPWKELGIGRVDTAKSGSEALKIMEHHVPDIMITDIRMAEIDGLTLVSKINEIKPGLRIIVLTGYNNFEYVQQCCKMDVHDYLLKPVDEDELAKTIKNQVEILEEKHSLHQKRRILSRAEGLAEQIKLEHAMRHILHGRAAAVQLERLLEEYQIGRNQQLRVALICPIVDDKEEWSQHYELLNLSVKNTCIELFDSNQKGITFEDDEKNIVLAIFNLNSTDESVAQVEQLNTFLKEEYEIRQKVFLGSEVTGLAQMNISYNDARILLGDSRTFEPIVQSRHSQMRLKLFYESFQEIKKTIEDNLGDADRAVRALQACTQAAESYNLSSVLMKKVVFELLSGVYFTYIQETGKQSDHRLSHLMAALSDGKREDIYHVAEEFLLTLLCSDEAGLHNTVMEAKRYIKEHLDEELSVSQLAAMLYVTPSYFSKLFKKNIGEGCNNYIVRKRMERAQSLLLTTTMRIGKIAVLTGYKDVNYFSLAFKKYAGCSPMEYREKKTEY